VGVGKGPDTRLLEAIAALFTSKGPCVEVGCSNLFKLDEAWGGVGPWSPQPPWGGKRGEHFFFF
jgi:hypothetical protein